MRARLRALGVRLVVLIVGPRVDLSWLLEADRKHLMRHAPRVPERRVPAWVLAEYGTQAEFDRRFDAITGGSSKARWRR